VIGGKTPKNSFKARIALKEKISCGAMTNNDFHPVRSNGKYQDAPLFARAMIEN
jgi:hypothetical protein